MENERITVLKVLSITVQMLRGIQIPGEYGESIGVPVARSIRNLTECINSYNKQKEAAKAEETEEDTEKE